MPTREHALSRRRFLTSSGLATLSLAFRPMRAYGQHEGDHLVTISETAGSPTFFTGLGQR